MTRTPATIHEGVRWHHLKTWPGPFAGVLSGDKKHEIRKRDRDYQVGDLLHLEEYDPSRDAYTGRSLVVRATYLSEGWGLPAELCVLSIAAVEVPAPARRERERGYVLFRCLVCGQQTTSSAIWRAQAATYDGGEHCGQPRVAIEWHAFFSEAK